MAKILKPFGISRLLYQDSFTNHMAEESLGAEQVSLDSLLAESDFVLACCALTPETTGLFNLQRFSQMKSSAIFINTSRGPVVVMDDLYSALRQGKIR